MSPPRAHMPPQDKLLLHFAPDVWTPSGKFAAFLGPPFRIDRQVKLSVDVCTQHWRKFEVFASVANRILPTLEEDAVELDTNGYSATSRSRELAAVYEALICELYAVLDGLRQTLFHLFKPCRGFGDSSTSRLFARAHENKLGPELPEPIRQLLAQAYQDWFPELRRLRSAFTHGGLGSCRLDRQTGLVSYMNPSLGDQRVAYVCVDIISHMEGFVLGVDGVVRGTFDHLYSKLDQIESQQLCGNYKYRFMVRTVAPEPDLGRGSGRCVSRAWFDKEPEFSCPMAPDCPAYSRAGPASPSGSS